jgi:hypothetical protein
MGRRPRSPGSTNQGPDSQEERMGGDPEAERGLRTCDREDQAPDEPWLVGNDGAT